MRCLVVVKEKVDRSVKLFDIEWVAGRNGLV